MQQNMQLYKNPLLVFGFSVVTMEGKTYKAIVTVKSVRKRRIEEKRNKRKQIKKVFDLDELKQVLSLKKWCEILCGIFDFENDKDEKKISEWAACNPAIRNSDSWEIRRCLWRLVYEIQGKERNLEKLKDIFYEFVNLCKKQENYFLYVSFHPFIIFINYIIRNMYKEKKTSKI